MTTMANGTPIPAAAARSESAPPYGGSGVGAEAPPLAPPPPPTALDGRVAEYQKLTDDMAAALKDQAAEIERLRGKPAKQPSRVWAKASALPKRHVVPLCIGATVVGITLGITQCTPRQDTATITRNAATIAGNEAQERTLGIVSAAAANNTQVVVPDPFSYYGLELTEDAKTAIGYDASTGNRTLNPARADYVAKQVRAALSQQNMALQDMRLSSSGPSDLRVHNNPAEGFPLFKPPAKTAPASMTPATTATSAP